MKIDRLIGIITILLQHGKVTAPYLAERFEVSRRTINRDIEDICKAGIPVVTMQGSSGGISIADGYRIDQTLFTKEELRAVLVGLKGLDSVAQDHKYQNIIDKFFPEQKNSYETDHILIDLSSHYKQSLAPKISDLQRAIEDLWAVTFTYYNHTGERQVQMNPYLVVFRWSNWYVFGYDLEKETFRLFKLNRLCDLRLTEQHFQMQEIPEEKLEFDKWFHDEIKAVISFDESVKYRLIEEYGTDCYTVLPNQKLRFEFSFTDAEYLMEWVLRFGDKAELLEPEDLRMEIYKRLEHTICQYKHDI